MQFHLSPAVYTRDWLKQIAAYGFGNERELSDYGASFHICTH
jgi:hypothetical protein